MHVQTLDAPGKRRADLVGVARLHRAYTEQRRRNRARFHGGNRHSHRCQRARPQAHVNEKRKQRDDDGHERQGAALHRQTFHVVLLMPRR